VTKQPRKVALTEEPAHWQAACFVLFLLDPFCPHSSSRCAAPAVLFCAWLQARSPPWGLHLGHLTLPSFVAEEGVLLPC
jgi:hypothetical protein